MKTYLVNLIRKILTPIRSLFLLSSAGNKLAPLIQAPSWEKVEATVEGNHTAYPDKSIVDAVSWKKPERQEFLKAWREYKRYKILLADQKPQTLKRFQERWSLLKGSTSGYYAECQSNGPDPALLLFDALKASLHQRKLKLLTSTQSDLTYLPRLPRKHRRLIQEKGIRAKVRLKFQQSFQKAQCVFLLRKACVKGGLLGFWFDFYFGFSPILLSSVFLFSLYPDFTSYSMRSSC